MKDLSLGRKRGPCGQLSGIFFVTLWVWPVVGHLLRNSLGVVRSGSLKLGLSWSTKYAIPILTNAMQSR